MRSRATPEQTEGPSVLDILLDPGKVPEEKRRVGPKASPDGGNGSVEASEPVEPDPSKLQRAVPRQPVDWEARYRFRNDPARQWHECRVSDISTAGAGLKIFDVEPQEIEGRKIDVQVQLSGEVRNVVTGMKKDLRVGIEFFELGADSAKFIDSLKRSDTRW